MRWRLLPATRLADFAPEWHSLQQAGIAAPMLGIDFVIPLVVEFGTGKELLAICERGGEVLAMAVLAPQSRWSWSTFQPAQAPVGLWLARADLDLLPLLGELIETLPGFPLLLGLMQCDPLLAKRPPDGANVRCLDYVDTARIPLHGNFDDFWAARGKNLRSNLKKQRSRLLKDGVTARLEICRTPDKVAAAIADYGRLESSGWKGSAGTAVATGNAQGRFYRQMLEAFCRNDKGSIFRYWFGEQLVAMDLCIEDRDCIVILKTSYDERVAHGLSPSLLMREEACRQLFLTEPPLRIIEFYGKVMEWHQRWTEDIRMLYHVNYYRWSWLNQLHALIRKTNSTRSDRA